jgi:diguanylate cyclase (GGDEF)-like protein
MAAANGTDGSDMDDKLDFLLDQKPQKILWLSCREAEDELLKEAQRPITSVSTRLPAVAPYLRASDQPREADTAGHFPCVGEKIPWMLVAPPALGADRDPWSGLHSPRHVSGIIGRHIANIDRRTKTAALVSFDLGGLPLLHEQHGRALEEEIMKAAAAVVASVAGPNAVIMRHGKDGFTVFVAGLSSAADIAGCVQQVLDAIAIPREVGGNIMRIIASAGIAMFPKDGEDLDTLSRNARATMADAKAKCPGAMRFHSGSVAVIAKRRLRLANDLRHAIENNELTLYYQPQFDIPYGRACGVEVLARWFRADGVVVEPSVFIPLAEQTQLIEALGAWVLQEACTRIQSCRSPGTTSMKLCVNVSPYQLNEAFPSVIQHVLEITGLPPERLELEITESALIGDADDIIECFRELKAIGVRIAIDDFGTGYSSLGYLSRLPVDRLKLDKSLIHNLTTHWKDVAILRALIGLGKELGIEVIAEGVETEHQFQILKQLGCPQAQGYLLARAAPDMEAREMLARRWGARSNHSRSMVKAARTLHVS